LRAQNNITVNKDGTTRYDMSEIPITHFKLKEIGTTVEKIKELGYEKDMNGKEITNDDQVIELRPQDLILPGGYDTLDSPAKEVLLNVSKFIDDLLVKLYKQKTFYNAKKPEDLIGCLGRVDRNFFYFESRIVNNDIFFLFYFHSCHKY